MLFIKRQLIVLAALAVLVVYWVILFISGLTEGFWNYFYSFSFSLIPFIGGFVGLFQAKPWGYLKSAIGRAIFFISAGSFAWGAGSMIWSYYNFFQNVAAPYPSLADIGFIGALPLWIIGVINLSKATGAKFALKNISGKLFLILTTGLLLLASYYLLVVVARGGEISADPTDKLKLFFDIAYPTGDVLILILAVVIFGLSFKYFGGTYKIAILSILFGFAFMYVADFIFSYTTTTETFYNGSFGDLVFTIALFLITFGIFGFAKPAITQTV